MNRKQKSEQGQVIILLVAGIITLLGFTALAIDGARLYSEHRHAQGVADTAAFTAAAYLGQFDGNYVEDNFQTGAWIDQDAEEAALNRIRSNGYTDPVYNPYGAYDRLRIQLHKVGGTLSPRYTVNVFLISEVDPIFAQLVYGGELLVNVEAEAIVLPRTNVGFGQAIVSLSETACGALQFTGGSTVDIDGTGIYANSSCDPSINFTGGTAVEIDENVVTPGNYDIDGGASLTSGGLDIGATPENFRLLPPPDCTGMPAGTILDDTTSVPPKKVFTPGIYKTKLNINDASVDHAFLPGLYCLEGGLSITNGNLYSIPDASGVEGVTFYIEKGNVSASGAVMDIVAPHAGVAVDSNNYDWSGMLFYVEGDTLDLKPELGSYFEGTIYAPSDKINPTCQMTGNGDTVGYNLQFVCNTVSLAGGAGLYIDFDGTNAHDPPVLIDLLK